MLRSAQTDEVATVWEISGPKTILVAYAIAFSTFSAGVWIGAAVYKEFEMPQQKTWQLQQNAQRNLFWWNSTRASGKQKHKHKSYAVKHKTAAAAQHNKTGVRREARQNKTHARREAARAAARRTLEVVPRMLPRPPECAEDWGRDLQPPSKGPTILRDFSEASCACRSTKCSKLAITADLCSESARRVIWQLDPKKKQVGMHRKEWEYHYIIRALNASGKLRPGMRGIVFGVGRDPLVSYFASLGVRVLATDLGPKDTTAWDTVSKDSLFREHLLSRSQFDELVEFRAADMNDISTIDGQFDFVWSTGSVQHVGSIALGKAFAMASMLLLKPGGMAVHTTEFSLSSLEKTVDSVRGRKTNTVIWRRRDVEGLLGELRKSGYKTAETCLSAGRSGLDTLVDLPPYHPTRHLRLQVLKHVVTSFGWVAWTDRA